MPAQPPVGLSFTRSKQDDGLLQFVAGMALVNVSGVLCWSEKAHVFECPTAVEYEKSWTERFDPVFGRVASWNMFSTGAEFLLKGLLLSYDMPIRGRKKVRNYPQATTAAGIQSWAGSYAQNAHDVMWVPIYGELGKVIGAPLQQLFGALEQKKPDNQTAQFYADRDLVSAAYDLLRGSIRNRDAHAYVPNVRNAHQPLREALLLPALNALAKWMPYSREFLSASYANRQSLVAKTSAGALDMHAPYPD